VASSCRHRSLAAEASGNLDLRARVSRLIGGRLGNVAPMLFRVNAIGQVPAPATIEGVCGAFPFIKLLSALVTPVTHAETKDDRKPTGARVGIERIAMKAHKAGVEIQQLDENRYAVAIDGVVHYVGTLEDCERRAAIFTARNDRAAQDRALGRLTR
jgi:hypothetical protein